VYASKQPTTISGLLLAAAWFYSRRTKGEELYKTKGCIETSVNV